jgi:hypothetical protein
MTKSFLPTMLALVLVAPMAFAKLPPLPADEQIKADEAKARTAWSDKVGAYKLCLSMERVAASYHKTAKSEGKETRPPMPTPPCTDPGPFAAAGAASSPKPLEASGAHSPAATATTPPSSNATEAQIAGKKK